MIKRIAVAPDSFKGSLTAQEAAEAIENGIRNFDPSIEVIKVPMADGGEGTVQSMIDATGGRLVKCIVTGPRLRPVEAFYGILGDGGTAVIEMAAASGLPLLKPEERNPMLSTTYGTGELIKHALLSGCRNFIIGLGGSATNDGGMGAMKALGVSFLDAEGNELGHGGECLGKLNKINMADMDSRLKSSVFTAACDVDNPLCGLKGASYVFGPQKGADGEMVEKLDNNLAHFSEIIARDLGINIKDYPGAGAAGGLGAGLMAFLNAKLKRGVDIVIEAVELEDKLKGVDLVITGEGMMDFQTVHGKTPYGVAKTAKKLGIPVVAICGSIGKGSEILFENGFDSIFSIVDKPMRLEEAMENSRELLERCSERVIRAMFAAINGKRQA